MIFKQVKYRIWWRKTQQHCRGLMWRDYSAKRPRRCPINVTRTALLCSFQFSILVQYQLGWDWTVERCPPLLISILKSDTISIEADQCRPLLISIFNSYSINQWNEVHCPFWLKVMSMDKEATTMVFVFDLQTGLLFFFDYKKSHERELNFDAKKVTIAFVLFKSGTLCFWYHF